MDVKLLKNTVENGKAYRQFKEESPDSYFAHAFVLVKNQPEWQLGYYDPTSKEITTFDIDGKLIGNDKALTSTDDIPELETDLQVTFKQAMEKVDALMQEHYRAKMVTQRICILQHLKVAVWNITLITNAFSTINIRIDAHTGEVIKHQEQSLMSMGTMIPGEKKE